MPIPSELERPTVRLRIDLAYDGTEFHGWAAQPGLRTVQGVLESSIARVLRLPTEGSAAPALTVAGRTDTGVHARGQVCHLDLPGTDIDPARLARRLGRLLPADLVVRGVTLAPAGFDARFAAIARRYAYRIADVPSAADPLQRGWVLGWPRRLDEAAMNAAAARLLGEHDFASFCKRREGASTVRELRVLEWSRLDGMLELRVVADAFCHHMVRALVGALVAVGEGRRAVSWPADVLTARARDSGVLVVPARGLTLEAVEYPPDDQLVARATAARSLRATNREPPASV